MRFWAALAVLILVPALASEAAQHYRPWTDPNAPTGAGAGAGSQQEFVDKLKGMIDEAEKARAADPGFLQDLRGLAREYDRPRRRVVLADRFEDGDFTYNPAWTVTQGRYWVERGWGLRSAVKTGTAAAQPAQEPERRKGRDVAAAIFGQILQQAIDPEGKLGSGQAGGETGAGTATAIQTAAPISNAFAVEMDFSSWGPEGRLEIGPYQGNPGGAQRARGYVLAYTPGGGMELLRVSSRGTSVIDRRTGLTALEDKKTHTLQWTRSADGGMTVAIDGREVLRGFDPEFREGFDGLRMVNRGGDYILKRITVFSTGN
jgi:hypothetical protein